MSAGAAASGGAAGGAGTAAAGSAGAPAAGQGGASAAIGGAGSGAAPAAAAAGTPSPAANAATPDWTSAFNDDHKGFVQNKGWKDQNQVVDSYRNLEKLVGAPPDQIIKLPKGDETDAKALWDGIYGRLGRPASPEGYKLSAPKEGGDPAFVKAAAETFHKLGLSEKQGSELVNWWNDFAKNGQATTKQAFENRIEAGRTSLKKEWGAAHEQNLSIAKRATREFGVDGKMIDAIESAVGYDGTMKFFHTLGTKIGDATFHGGNPGGSNGNGPMTPAAATARIKELSGDPGFVKRYTSGDAAARAEMERLHIYKVGEGA